MISLALFVIFMCLISHYELPEIFVFLDAWFCIFSAPLEIILFSHFCGVKSK